MSVESDLEFGFFNEASFLQCSETSSATTITVSSASEENFDDSSYTSEPMMGRHSSPKQEYCVECRRYRYRCICARIGYTFDPSLDYVQWRRQLENTFGDCSIAVNIPEAISGSTTPDHFPHYTDQKLAMCINEQQQGQSIISAFRTLRIPLLLENVTFENDFGRLNYEWNEEKFVDYMCARDCAPLGCKGNVK